MEPEMDMMGGEPAAAGPLAMVDELVAAVLAAKGADPQMVASLPPLTEDMVQGDPALAAMVAEISEASMSEEDMFDDAVAEDAGIPCAKCPDPAGCRKMGKCMKAA